MPTAPEYSSWQRLGLTPEDLFDADALLARVTGDASDPAKIRDLFVSELSEARLAARARVAEVLQADPFAAREAISAYSYITDQMLCATFRMVTQHLHPNPNPTNSEQMSVIAVGGYGRAEMAPFSDVDLLFLTPYKQTAWGESVIESTLYILWDLKIKLGHSVRTVDECLRQAKADVTIRTSLLENRFLFGAEELAEELNSRLWSELFDLTGPEFVEAKLEERGNRHKRNGGSRYLVEPNVKESKGGLRDLQTLFWLAKYLNHTNSIEDLVSKGVFTAEEVAIFREAENFLWTARVHLHLVTGRATEKLTFDAQVELAAILGFKNTRGQRGVERFMQTYFTHAKRVGELTRVFLVGLEAKHVKARPSLTQAFSRWFSHSSSNLSAGYVINNGRLDVEDERAMEKDPVNILRTMQEGLRTGLLLHPNAMRQITSNVHRIGQKMRKDPVANKLFVNLLLDKNDPIRALRRLNELDFLGAFIPEFGKIVAMMQFNMYHHYTVDEHTLQCLTQLFQIEQGLLKEPLPVASSILERGVNRRVLYVAMLLHDIGKGRPEDHSIIGAKIAAKLCPRFGLSVEETETVTWLVRNHLVMSDFAQKRDLSDARTLRDFAAIVQTPARLKLLCVLTVCDIRGVGPGVWNNWKAVLIRDLYTRTLEILTGETDPKTTGERIAAAKVRFASALPDWTAEEVEAETNRHYDTFWLGLPTEIQTVMAQLGREAASEGSALSLDPDTDRDATRACFTMPDHPGLFSRIAGALALSNANVVDARTFTTSDGMWAAVFWIQDDDCKPFESVRLPRLRKTISRTLAGEVVAMEAFATKDKLTRRERDFEVPTEITINNDGSEIFSIIEVDTRDRPGLLYDLTRTLSDSGISIYSAIIATYGEQVVDTFYVKDLFGLKLHSRNKQAQIRTKLLTAIRQGRERAKG
ncbi:[protein-PII] uridylyltransferase [Algicella marina]|uniref:Bifunctional uridylyltransferase/uridylyl-removing enzyme n=1 Tax=Algicella marina TaxID=2683284 RepID=A0A6P1T7X0_9RHOB|nr:[protein-PII] uridylyltransferase [Algicella marina]